MKTLELLSRIEDEYSATGDLGITTLQMIRGAIEELQQAQTAPVVPDTDLLKRVTDVAAMLYSEWENGVPCYEDPDDSAGYLGNAFKLDDGADDRCVRIITEAESYLSAAPSAPAPSEDAGWLPIETAPKDGSRIMLGCPESDEQCAISTIGWWQEAEEDGVDYMGADAGFVDFAFQVFGPGRSFGNPTRMYAATQPTHWMPLPSAPLAATAQQKESGND